MEPSSGCAIAIQFPTGANSTAGTDVHSGIFGAGNAQVSLESWVLAENGGGSGDLHGVTVWSSRPVLRVHTNISRRYQPAQ